MHPNLITCPILQCMLNYDVSSYYGTQKVTSELWTPAYTSLKHYKDKKNIGWLCVVSDCQTVSLMAVVIVSVSACWKLWKWKLLNVSAGEQSHQRESQNHSSPSWRETALTQQNLKMCTFGKKKNTCAYVHSEFQLIKWLLRACDLHLSVATDAIVVSLSSALNESL